MTTYLIGLVVVSILSYLVGFTVSAPRPPKVGSPLMPPMPWPQPGALTEGKTKAQTKEVSTDPKQSPPPPPANRIIKEGDQPERLERPRVNTARLSNGSTYNGETFEQERIRYMKERQRLLEIYIELDRDDRQSPLGKHIAAQMEWYAKITRL